MPAEISNFCARHRGAENPVALRGRTEGQYPGPNPPPRAGDRS